MNRSRALRLLVALVLSSGLLVAISAAPVTAAEDTGPTETIQWHGGKVCHDYSRGSWDAEVCVFVNVHDWLQYKQAIVRVSGDQLCAEIPTVNLWRNTAVVKSASKQACASTVEAITGWWTNLNGCSCPTYQAQGIGVKIDWPDGHTTNVGTVWSNSINGS